MLPPLPLPAADPAAPVAVPIMTGDGPSCPLYFGSQKQFDFRALRIFDLLLAPVLAAISACVTAAGDYDRAEIAIAALRDRVIVAKVKAAVPLNCVPELPAHTKTASLARAKAVLAANLLELTAEGARIDQQLRLARKYLDDLSVTTSSSGFGLYKHVAGCDPPTSVENRSFRMKLRLRQASLALLCDTARVKLDRALAAEPPVEGASAGSCSHAPESDLQLLERSFRFFNQHCSPSNHAVCTSPHVKIEIDKTNLNVVGLACQSCGCR